VSDETCLTCRTLQDQLAAAQGEIDQLQKSRDKLRQAILSLTESLHLAVEHVLDVRVPKRESKRDGRLWYKHHTNPELSWKELADSEPGKPEEKPEPEAVRKAVTRVQQEIEKRVQTMQEICRVLPPKRHAEAMEDCVKDVVEFLGLEE
jgi:hypothetical protein